LGCVPILSEHQFSLSVIDEAVFKIAESSAAVPGWSKAEGVVVHIDGSNYKVVINGDENKRVG